MTALVSQNQTSLQNQNNLTRWNPQQQNFLETYFLQWRDIAQDHVGWLRYVLYQSETQASCAAVWATVIERLNPANTISIKQTFPLDKVTASTDSFQLTIANSGLNNQAAWGEAISDSDRIQWNLQIADQGVVLRHLPEALYQWKLPPTKYVAPFCGCQFSGHIAVNDRVIQLDRVPGLEAHFWGTKLVTGWTWSHCKTFKEDPDFIFDGVAPKDTVAGISLPSVPFFFFFWEGQPYHCNHLIRSLYLNKSNSDLCGWRFTAQHQDLRFVGEITSRPEEMLVYRSQNLNGTPHFTHLTFHADMSIRIERRSRSGWTAIKKLTSEQSTTFEFAAPEHDARVQWWVSR